MKIFNNDRLGNHFEWILDYFVKNIKDFIHPYVYFLHSIIGIFLGI